MITRRQYQRLIQEHKKRANMTVIAMKAEVCRNTARKYVKAGQSPAELKKRHDWRTRKDPFDTVWDSEIVPLLRREERLMPLTIMEWLMEKHPGEFAPGQLRTLQRRVKQWKLMNGPEKEVYFPQESQPGRKLQVDWTNLNELGILIGGKPYPHLLFHGVLAHSNWQWGMRARSESYLSLQNGLQETLSRLGGVPQELWVDNTTAATCRLGATVQGRRFNDAFESLCEHFGLKPQVIQVGCPNENGDVESWNGHLKRRLDQQLLLRGHRDFESLESYDKFLHEVFEKANESVKVKADEEKTFLRGLPPTRLPDWKEYDCQVSHYSTVQIQKTTYSVPSRLIGVRLRARLKEDQISLFHGREEVVQLQRRHWQEGARIDYRHVIDQLIRKPGAFARYRWRHCLFPARSFEAAYEWMVDKLGERVADREYLHLLKVATDHGQGAVEEALEGILNEPAGEVSVHALKERLGVLNEVRMQVQSQAPLEVSLDEYDKVLSAEVIHES